MSKSVIRSIFTIVLTAFILACASGQLSSVQQDLEAKMFSVPSNTGKGRVYVARPLGLFAGAGVLTHVMVDGRIAASVGPKNFFMLDVSTGSHIFTVLGYSKQQLLQVNVVSGKLYFIEVQHIAGALTLLPEEEGRRLVRESKRIEPNL